MLVFQQLADKIPESSTIGSLKPIRSRCCSSTWQVSFQCSWTRGPQKTLRGKRLILEISRSYVACLEKERGRGVPLCRGSPAALTPRPGVCPPTQGWRWDRCWERTTGHLLTRPALAFPEGHGVCSGEKHFHISSVYLFSIWVLREINIWRSPPPWATGESTYPRASLNHPPPLVHCNNV